MIPQHVHFIGVGGRAMGGIAIALKREGHRVTGSDAGAYEPMSGCLRRAGLPFATRYDPANIPAETNIVIVGKRVPEANPELQWAIRSGLRVLSFPKFLRSYFLGRSQNAVIAGGVGKTTTTAMLTWILERAGLRPDYLIGGIPHNLQDPARLTGAPISVLEGDEYASCFDDATPKFLHYAPTLVAITNILADHPDIYPDQTSLHAAFKALVRLLPPEGRLLLPAADPALGLAKDARCPVVTVGLSGDADHPVTALALSPKGCVFRLEGARFDLPLWGRMNVRNAAMAAAAAAHFGVSWEESARALALFTGLVDRQDARDVGTSTIVTDKACHPESLREVCQALRQRYPRRRILSVVQPRATGGRQWIYQRDLPDALAAFDKVFLTSAYEHAPPPSTPWQDDPFCIETLASALRARDVDVTVVPALADLSNTVPQEVREGDVVLLSLREQFTTGVAAAVEAAVLGRYSAA